MTNKTTQKYIMPNRTQNATEKAVEQAAITIDTHVDMVRQNENAVDTPDAAAEISQFQGPMPSTNMDLHTGDMPNVNQTWTHNSTKKQYTLRYRPAKYPVHQGQIPVAKPLIKAVSEKTVEVSDDVLTNQASDILKHDRAYGDYVTLFTGPNDEVKLQKIQQYRDRCVANLEITHQRIKTLVCDLETSRQRISALNESEQQHYDIKQLILSNSIAHEKHILMLLRHNMQLLTQQTTTCVKAITTRVVKKEKSSIELSFYELRKQALDRRKHERAYGDNVTLFTGPNDEVKLQKIQQCRDICAANLEITHQRIKALACDLETTRQRISALNESEQQHYDIEQFILSNSIINEKYILMLLRHNMQLLTQQRTACVKDMTSRMFKKAKSNIK